MTKLELKKLISESYKINKAHSVSSEDLILVADNTDSIFFKATTLKIYTERKSPKKNNFCRTVELKFLDEKFMNFLDCQVCKEPSNCYVTTENKIFAFEIVEENETLFLVLKNKFENKKYKVQTAERNEENKITEFTLLRI